MKKLEGGNVMGGAYSNDGSKTLGNCYNHGKDKPDTFKDNHRSKSGKRLTKSMGNGRPY